MDKSAWADHLLKDEWFQEMLQELRSTEISKFAMSNYADSAVREEAYRQLRALESIENYLEGLIAQKAIDGKRMKIL